MLESNNVAARATTEKWTYMMNTNKKTLLNFFLELADAAWEEVLKEKIKEHLLSTQNDRMAELAKIVAEATTSVGEIRWRKKHGSMDFKEKLGRFFGQSKK